MFWILFEPGLSQLTFNNTFKIQKHLQLQLHVLNFGHNMQWVAVHYIDLLLRYLEIIMMHGNFSWVPDNSSDCVTLLQRLVDQVLSSLSCSAEYGDLHLQTPAQMAQSGTADSDLPHLNSQEVPSLFRHLSVQKWLLQCNNKVFAENASFEI